MCSWIHIYIYSSSCQLFFASAKRKFIAIMTCRLDSQCQAKFQRPAKFPVPSESAYEMLSLDIYQWPAKSTSTYFDQVAEIVRHVCGRPGHDWQIVNGPGKSDLRLFMDTLLKGPSCGPTHVAPDHEAPDAEMSEVYINGVKYNIRMFDDDPDGEVIVFFEAKVRTFPGCRPGSHLKVRTHEAPVVCARKLVINIDNID